MTGTGGAERVGVLPIWKPAGLTSHDVVAKARRLLHMKRIGHTGTLDPQVTGVLPLCLGRTTRLVEYIQEAPKEYAATMIIGYATDTEDLEGTVVERVDEVKLTKDQALSALAGFEGVIRQIPPMYSALKVDGKRLYEWARQGVELERQAREAILYSLTLTDWRIRDDGYPELSFRVTCSKGTYIRTLCKDIGAALGYPSVMSRLVRTSTGHIGEERCVTLEQLEALVRDGREEEAILPPDYPLRHIPQLTLSADLAERALHGQKLRLPSAPESGDAEKDEILFRAYSSDGRFLGMFLWDKNGRLLKPKKIMAASD
ncbi:tRNA pseudouridine synthase B [Xylanibacillus composti]|uniref:tRNA pseudouridine synthase B n=1 Tax=Xylanibacillus composti TaxID=1572762 RepID=A0A8J4H2Y6_9BACL|nr:tRNA pseudouridine(55) synthase TruB [Xylanibacillus composti]GIQ68596.1 tRNA pseudouridine synthase B [Xylanibacillus composti]